MSQPHPTIACPKYIVCGNDDVRKITSPVDPETGQKFTIKRYESEKVDAEGGTWRHVQISLLPVNPDFEPIVLNVESEGQVSVEAEFLEVL